MRTPSCAISADSILRTTCFGGMSVCARTWISEISPQGEISEIHVLAQTDIPPKQVVRNIESALMAQLGVRIDHRKISVAQTADVRPIEQLQEEAISTRSKR